MEYTVPTKAFEFVQPVCQCGSQLLAPSMLPTEEAMLVSCSCGLVLLARFWRRQA